MRYLINQLHDMLLENHLLFALFGLVNKSICDYAKALKTFTTCQAYANQVDESFVPLNS